MDGCHVDPPARAAAPYRRHIIQVDDVTYPFLLGYDALGAMLAEVGALEPDRIVLVTDDVVAALHVGPAEKALRAYAPTLVLTADAGEKTKTPAALFSYAQTAIEWGVTRRSIVVTVGGGVPGNLGGLLAGLLFRGIRLVHVPTTLMAMSDSVISLKQAVNIGASKNVFGTYHAPEMIVADPALLDTLPAQHWRSGLCEAIKNALAIRPSMREPLLRLLAHPMPWLPDDTLWLIEECIRAKLQVMRHDRRERRAGLALEYGHTIGHAIEMAESAGGSNGTLSHGEAVALGMVASALVAERLGYGSAELVQQHVELVDAVGVERVLPAGVEPSSVVDILWRDNKRGYLANGYGGAMGMILLRAPGEPVVHEGLPLTPVPMPVISEAVSQLAAPLDASEPRAFPLRVAQGC